MKNIKRLFGVLNRWKAHYQFAGLLLVVSSFIRMLEPKVLQIAVDGIIGLVQNTSTKTEDPDQVVQFFYQWLPDITRDSLWESLLWITIIFVTLALFQVLTRFFAQIIAASSTEKAIKHLRDHLFSHIQALPIARFQKFGTGEMIQRCTGDVDTVRNFIGTQVTELVRLGAVFVGAFSMMLLVHVPYAFISIALVLPIMITSYMFFRRESKVWEEHEKEQDKLTEIIQENLSGIRVVQAFAQEKYEINKFKKQNERKLGIGIKHIRLHQYFWTFSDFLVHTQVAISIFAGGYFTLHNQITLGEFASFFTYAVVVTWPLRNVGRILSQMGMAAVAMERMSEIIDAEEEDYSGQYQPVRLDGTIEFKNVSFKYESEDDVYALDDVSFKIEKGETVALMGGTGSGKSTIIALLLRLYEPTSGEIFVDNIPLNQMDKKSLRSRMSIVHQKPFLFSTTIKDNIAFTKTEATDEDIKEMAEAASVGDFINKLPDGYATMVGEKGVNLSGGQKQRITLARALLRQPDILVLDDATSAVDTETEHNIQNALTKYLPDKTTFIIAHRLTSVQNAKKILVFDKGKLIQEGDHDSLSKEEGFYKKVYDIQMSFN